MRKVNVAGRVDEVQQIVLSVCCAIGQRDGVALDRDSPLAFDVHRIEHLIMELTLIDTSASLYQSIRQCRLAVIDVSDNAEVSNVFHASRFDV